VAEQKHLCFYPHSTTRSFLCIFRIMSSASPSAGWNAQLCIAHAHRMPHRVELSYMAASVMTPVIENPPLILYLSTNVLTAAETLNGLQWGLSKIFALLSVQLDRRGTDRRRRARARLRNSPTLRPPCFAHLRQKLREQSLI